MVVLVAGLLGAGLLPQDAVSAVVVAVAPHTMQLGADQGGTVTVHAEIPFCQVNCDSLQLSGIPATGAKPDNRGELVAMFDEVSVKAIVALPSTTLTLTGARLDGSLFSGADTVSVKEWR
jgi:hypothetical protein